MTCPKCAAEDDALSVIRTKRNVTIDGKFSPKCDVRQMLCNPALGGCGSFFFTETFLSAKKTPKSEQSTLFQDN
jgi:hypothetical protein